MPWFEPCQFFNVVADHPFERSLPIELKRNIGVRTQLRRSFKNRGLGTPSKFAPGQWVQVLNRESIGKTLDAEFCLRGLMFLPYQWATCDGLYKVQKVVRRILDDAGRYRPVSNTVLLEGVVCSPTEGCGRNCPLMFRDEWLRPANAPSTSPSDDRPRAYARVRSEAEIRAQLDGEGKRDGLQFMPEMTQWTGKRFAVLRRVDSIFEYNRYVSPRRPIYILDGLHCSGAILGRDGPCDRACSILWHEDWLDFEKK